MPHDKNYVLEFHIATLRKTLTDHDYFEMLVLKIIPLIRLSHPDLVEKYKEEIKSYKQLQEKVQQEGFDALTSLKQQLEKRGLVNNPIIKKCIGIITGPYICLDRLLIALLDLGYVDIVREYVEVEDCEKVEQIYSCFDCGFKVKNTQRFICQNCTSKRLQVYLEKNSDKEYEEVYSCFNCKFKFNAVSIQRIIKDNQNLICPKCTSDHFQVNQTPVICKRIKFNLHTSSYSYVFDNSNVELMNRTNEYKRNDIRKAHIGWDYLSKAEWSSQNNRNFFKKKKLTYQKIKQKRKTQNDWLPSENVLQKSWHRDGQLLGKQTINAEMKAIQKKHQGANVFSLSKEGKSILKRTKKTHLFNRKLFDNYLDVVLGTACNTSQKTLPAIDLFRPCLVSLVMKWFPGRKNKVLSLFVEWEKGIKEVFYLHSFNNDKKGDYYKFVDSLLNNLGKPVRVPLEDLKKRNTTEYLKRIGIHGILGELFIKEKTQDEVSLLSNRILLTGKSQKILKKLHQHIRTLKFIKWTR
jgi:DNA-directed RNA polymerase subunit RPC12/RpoP